MRPIFQLFRFPNLIIVAILQGLIYFKLLAPLLREYQIQASLPPLEFGLFVFATTLITGSGYVINDLMDYEADFINRKGKVIVRKKIPVSVASWLYFGTVVVGFFVSLFLAFFSNNQQLLWLFPAAVFSLYIYSQVLKRKVLVGNLLISAFAGGVAGIVALALRDSLWELKRIAPDKAHFFLLVLWVYAGFAFLTTLFREVVKDIEDIKGDKFAGYRTLPIVVGEKFSRGLAIFIGVFLLVVTLGGFISVYHWIKFHFPGQWVWMTVVAISTVFLEGAALYQLAKANRTKDYRLVSQFIKLIMVMGIVFLAFIRPL